jgi:hypothetical protein
MNDSYSGIACMLALCHSNQACRGIMSHLVFGNQLVSISYNLTRSHQYTLRMISCILVFVYIVTETIWESSLLEKATLAQASIKSEIPLKWIHTRKAII